MPTGGVGSPVLRTKPSVDGRGGGDSICYKIWYVFLLSEAEPIFAERLVHLALREMGFIQLRLHYQYCR